MALPPRLQSTTMPLPRLPLKLPLRTILLMLKLLPRLQSLHMASITKNMLIQSGPPIPGGLFLP